MDPAPALNKLAMWHWLKRSPDGQFIIWHAAVIVGFQCLGEEYFRFQYDWYETGEIWRLISAHWIHVGWLHLLLNLLGLMICVSLSRPNWSLARWWLSCLLLALGVSLLMTLLNPEILWYAGFSGVLFGLYLLAAQDLYRRDRLIAVLMIAVVVVKVALEQFGTANFDSATYIGAPVVVDAHLYGLLTAMAIAIALIWSRYTMNHDSTEQSN